MSIVTTQRLRWWDIPQLLDIEAQLFGAEAWTEGMFWAELAAGRYYRVVREDAVVLGYAGMVVTGDEAWINNIAVRLSAQRSGVGAAMMRDLMAEAAARGVRRVALEVAVDNTPAQRMYDAFGFDGIAVRRGYYQPSNTDALVMAHDFESDYRNRENTP